MMDQMGVNSAIADVERALAEFAAEIEAVQPQLEELKKTTAGLVQAQEDQAAAAHIDHLKQFSGENVAQRYLNPLGEPDG